MNMGSGGESAWQTNRDVIQWHRKDSSMSEDARQREIDRNFDYFQSRIRDLYPAHRGEFVLLRNQEIVGFYGHVEDAARDAGHLFPDSLFSIQVVEPEPVDLGFFSRA
jgi:hypothetical protein